MLEVPTDQDKRAVVEAQVRDNLDSHGRTYVFDFDLRQYCPVTEKLAVTLILGGTASLHGPYLLITDYR